MVSSGITGTPTSLPDGWTLEDGSLGFTDDCGVHDADSSNNNTSCTQDACNVWGGDGSSCAGCDGVPNSGLVDDECGVCGGDGSSCYDPCDEATWLDKALAGCKELAGAELSDAELTGADLSLIHI